MYFILTFFCALGFSLIHYFSKYMKFAGKIPRSRFLSLTAGVAVAYVFVHLLPELNDYQEVVSQHLENSYLGYIENHIYIIAMSGLVLFYALERVVKLSKVQDSSHNALESDQGGIFWLHISVFSIYNAVIGYLLINENFRHPSSLLFYFIALSVHFITNDWGLRRNYQQAYDRYGRIILSFAPLLGWIMGTFIEINDFGVSVLQAFIAGSVILNVMKEELPEEQQSSIISFLCGVVGYTFLLLLV